MWICPRHTLTHSSICIFVRSISCGKKRNNQGKHVSYYQTVTYGRVMEVPKLHVFVSKLAFWGNFIIVLKCISARNLKKALKLLKMLYFYENKRFSIKMYWRKICFSWMFSLPHFSRKVLFNSFNLFIQFSWLIKMTNLLI